MYGEMIRRINTLPRAASSYQLLLTGSLRNIFPGSSSKAFLWNSITSLVLLLTETGSLVLLLTETGLSGADKCDCMIFFHVQETKCSFKNRLTKRRIPECPYISCNFLLQ